MSKTSRVACLFLLLLLIATCLVTVQSGSAQTNPKPSVPEFTLTLKSHPYDVPPTTYTNVNPSTGETTNCNTAGYRDNNQTITITIKNQSFSTGPNYTYWLFYDVEIKDYYHNNWTELYSFFGASGIGDVVQNYFCNNPIDSQVSVKVKAILQNKTQFFVPPIPGFPASLQPNSGYHYGWTPISSSEWSAIETLSLSDGSISVSSPVSFTISPTSQLDTSSSENPTVNPTLVCINAMVLPLEWLWAVVIVVVAVVFALLFVVIFFMRRRIKALEMTPNGA